MIHKVIKKPVDVVIETVKKNFEREGFSVLNIENKGEYKTVSKHIKVLVLTLEKNGKFFKTTLVSNAPDITILSAVFPKKMFTQEEEEKIKNLIENL